jgi:predicted nucleic acid-binding protein
LAELICDTSALLALHQIGYLNILRSLSTGVVVPSAVQAELEAGRSLGYDTPDVANLNWMTIRSPSARPLLANVSQLGLGESEVLWLAQESTASVAVLDDEPARRIAMQVGVSFTGTLGLLVDAKRAGLIAAVTPLLDELERCKFHMSPQLRQLISQAAGEAP